MAQERKMLVWFLTELRPDGPAYLCEHRGVEIPATPEMVARIWEECPREEEWLAQTQICQTLNCSNLAEDRMLHCRPCNDEQYLTDMAVAWLDRELEAVDWEGRS